MVNAQNVTVTDDDEYTPKSSAMLDVQSTDKGMLVPRMDSLSRIGISSPAAGLLVYDTNAAAFYYFNGTKWLNLTTNVTSPANAGMEEALFSVVNAKGDTVFAVYQEGVVINVGDGDAKGNRGGFAVGGLSSGQKTEKPNYLHVSGDSVRVWVDTAAVKGNRGGFAVGGLSSTGKNIGKDYLTVSDDSVRVYIHENTAKGNRGGFAVGGLSAGGKSTVNNLFYVDPDTTAITNILSAATNIVVGGDIFGADGGFYTSTDSVTDYDGNVYPVVAIGNQVWMAKNLMTTHYADGTPLVDGTPQGDITGDYITKYYFWYQDEYEVFGPTYGALYTWAAAMNEEQSSDANPSGVQGVCPDGWHLPSDEEWKELEMYLGMDQENANATGWSRGANEGSKLAGAAELWQDGALENDLAFGTSDFHFIPSGFRSPNGAYNFIGVGGYGWSSTEYNTTQSWYRSLDYSVTVVNRNTDYSKDNGIPVRCIKD